MVNSYFNVLIQYGDEFETLGFRDLIEIKSRGESDLNVDLRNPEYDITRAVKKVLYAYQGSGALFDTISHQVTFKGYISPDDRLPKQLVDMRKELDVLLEDLKEKSGGKLVADIQDPDKDGGALAKKIELEYGFRPMALSLFSNDTFWFYMVLEGNDRLVQVPLPDDFSKESLQRGIEAALKRFSGDFSKPGHAHPADSRLCMPASGKRFSWLRDAIAVNTQSSPLILKMATYPRRRICCCWSLPRNR